jgi:hypothetical protein
LELGAFQPFSELDRPVVHRQVHCCFSGKRNGPTGKNAEHDCKRDEMRRVKQKSPTPCLPKDSQHDRIEKYKKRGPLREHAKPKKN